MGIALTEVQSSQIHAVGYSPETKTLAVQFKAKGGPGNVYEYADVAPEQFDAFVTAESLGRHFSQNVKGKFEFKKIEPVKATESESNDA